VTLLFDADEHTGRFGGAKRYFSGPDAPDDVAGVMIGYPGLDHVVIGGRGFWRADITVFGVARHSGSGRDHSGQVNAVEKAGRLIAALAQRRRPGPVDEAIGLPPRLTVTAVHGGEGHSVVPDRCQVSVDVRLTTSFDARAAEQLVSGLVQGLDERLPVGRPSRIDARESWPAYRLAEGALVARALLQAAEAQLDAAPTPKVAGPSNIGNYLASRGIPATAGFGVRYEGLHATDERIDIATIPVVQATYHQAVERLLSG
jgi:succinyl-diaminopimelate desuccinylase